MVKVLTGGGVSSGSPNRTDEKRGGQFEAELTSDAYHGGFVVRFINGPLGAQCQHKHVNRW